ncbi:hypothetical protein EFP18_25345 [Burkholderia glumae]|uniref:hypothetical protein n=1 Tax=Burkholderia glumae TaxID=337 RepID=UPI00036F4500|nr:hypothetical protein [Burkholderia glumae]MCQ0029852.1 hypothetical protein [Burkholderia glumae]MCQ0035431.1 hypothetical protein [Burkholderia glumae]MCR1768088.1 hypothetical protein [Burkholderia glumae]QHE13419.1 hypothetical protein GQR88_24600 [Burkholderia glumae AU6208]QHP92841.1 hypothetical protein EXE55_17845 [Burkholderia glumae]
MATIKFSSNLPIGCVLEESVTVLVILKVIAASLLVLAIPAALCMVLRFVMMGVAALFEFISK